MRVISLIDTVRIILFLDCNLLCPYCCNQIPEYRSRFQERVIDEIDFGKYRNVVITGGEPFLHKGWLYSTLAAVPVGKAIYMNTNGILINDEDVEWLRRFNVKGVTIGLHFLMQPAKLNPRLPMFIPVRYRCWEKTVPAFLEMWPGVLDKDNLRGFEMNKCDMPNEDWVLLKELG